MNTEADNKANAVEELSFDSFSEFYPFYLSEHQNVSCRRLHFIGTGSVIVLLIWICATETWLALLAIPALGYTFAWVGHFFFEKNKPATFKFPIYSLVGDFVMFKDILMGKVKV
nr:DUF962 domain-containing protein [Hyphomonas sp. Mor2]